MKPDQRIPLLGSLAAADLLWMLLCMTAKANDLEEPKAPASYEELRKRLKVQSGDGDGAAAAGPESDHEELAELPVGEAAQDAEV